MDAKSRMKVPPMSVPNVVAIIAVIAGALLVAMRAGFRPVNLT